ncbi:MAG: hypothetical protein JRN57_04265 [Nitrososphaerota archaeon]|nr:hypothetical protein [Nitrososphaerota archaeon]
MNQAVSMILSLRRVLESAGEGSGMSRSIVQELSGSDELGREAAKLLLLGNPIRSAMRPMLDRGAEEVALLASLIVAAPKSSAPEVGRSGSAVSTTLERWVKAKEGRALEQKVMRFRSLVTSGILGAVMGMVATLGPLLGSLGAGAGQGPDAAALVYGAAAMTAISSGMLGAYMSGRGFGINVAVSVTSFAVVCAVASPLAAVPSFNLWGVK